MIFGLRGRFWTHPAASVPFVNRVSPNVNDACGPAGAALVPQAQIARSAAAAGLRFADFLEPTPRILRERKAPCRKYVTLRDEKTLPFRSCFE